MKREQEALNKKAAERAEAEREMQETRLNFPETESKEEAVKTTA